METPVKPTLGRLVQAHPRDYWANEAAEFTPWLAAEENIGLLSEAIKIDLEVEQQEVAVGPFRADILCRDTATGQLVLVENQLERTDHTHLGQLFTYAAGLDAVTVVWIAQRFTEEHRAALDWLNRITHEDFRFFGIEVELWKIGASAMAPKLNVVARPNDWSKTVREVTGGPRNASPETQALQAEFWQGVGEVAAQRGTRFRLDRPVPRSWIEFGVGRGGFSLGAYVHFTTHAKEGSVVVFFYIRSDESGLLLRQLSVHQAEIEREIGAPLRWDEKPGRKNSSVALAYDYLPPDRARWPAMQTWVIEKLEAFDRVFRPRLRRLDPTTEAEDEEL